ncbi:hypothetical protein IFM46972_00517 [Aspergillus udagawae]|uniref:Uncharacterized protein n=1 Tax=Aspergillus udagawae TaxID=91492 RepID=A0A8H3N2L2_9EURO|nr:hypothetical protein IFM46972_00517 [Aspergillus udagawae]
MDLRTPSALPDITDIGTFPSGGAYSSRTSSEPHALLAQLLKAHFLRLRKTLLLTIRLEFETAHLLDSSIGPLSIGPAQSELRFEHLPAHGEGEGAGGQETSAKDMDIEAGDYDISDDDKEDDAEEEEGGKKDKPISSDNESDSDAGKTFLTFSQQLYQNHLCFVVSNGPSASHRHALTNKLI